jgi:hypothetical protein
MTVEYDIIMTEGDLRRMLANIEQRRSATDRAYCLRFHIVPGENMLREAHGSIEPLTPEMIAAMRLQGDLEFSGEAS